MKKLFVLLFIAISGMALNNVLFAQNVAVTPGGFGSPFPSLVEAFVSINAGNHGATPLVEILASHTQSDSAVLRVNNVTIRPTASVTITMGVAGTGLPRTFIALNGADNTVLDGRVGGVGTTIALTFTNSSTSGLAGTWHALNGANNNVVRYCNLNLGFLPTSSAGGINVNVRQSNPGSGGNNDNIIEFNVISGGARTIQTFGTAGAAGFTNDRTIVRNNKVKNFTNLGIFIGSETVDNVVTENEVFNDGVVFTALSFNRAISMQGVGVSEVRRNYIHDWDYTNTPAGLQGIFTIPVRPTVPGAIQTATVNVVNNMVSIGSAPGATSIFGLFPASNVNTVFNYTTNCYYNSVRIYGASTATLAAFTAGIELSMEGSTSVYNQFNNVVRNDRTGGSATATHVGIDLNTDSTKQMDINSDYNTTSAQGTARSFAATFFQPTFGTLFENVDIREFRDTVASFNIRQGNFNINNSELHTAFRPVDFISNTNLHLVAATVGGDMNARPFPGITTVDFDGETRSATFPYRGADELVGSPLKVLSLTYALEAITNAPPPPSNTNQADVITVELRTSGCALITSTTATLPAAPGNTALAAFGDLVTNGTPYYIKVIHRNSITVWSATTQSFTGGALSYDFTDLATKAFGSAATKLINGEWSAYAGDVNQDGIIDAGDISALDNASGGIGINPFDPGYAETDVNFDIFIDASDQSIVDNNVGVFEQAPCSSDGPVLYKISPYDAKSIDINKDVINPSALE